MNPETRLQRKVRRGIWPVIAGWCLVAALFGLSLAGMQQISINQSNGLYLKEHHRALGLLHARDRMVTQVWRLRPELEQVRRLLCLERVRYRERFGVNRKPYLRCQITLGIKVPSSTLTTLRT